MPNSNFLKSCLPPKQVDKVMVELHKNTTLVAPTILPKEPLKAQHSLKQLLHYYDTAFIYNAYEKILGRPAETTGLEYYLHQLRSHKLSKIEILGHLRYSPEGRQEGKLIKGLWLRLLFCKLNRIPVIGYFTRLIVAIFTLPSVVRSVENIDSFAHTSDQCRKAQELTSFERINNQLEKLSINLEATQQQITKLRRDQNSSQLNKIYLDFENQFRGTREHVKTTLIKYVPKIKSTHLDTSGGDIIDIGCGRGEWLEMLRNEGLEVKGIDMNPLMISFCQELSLPVVQADALDYLQNIDTQSISIITGFHIIEHMPTDALLTLLNECYRVLKSNGCVLFETPNPGNLIIGACNFYTDPSHISPLPSHTLQFLLQAVGFVQIDIIVEERERIVTKNDYLNEFINTWFNQAPDYAIIARKL